MVESEPNQSNELSVPDNDDERVSLDSAQCFKRLSVQLRYFDHWILEHRTVPHLKSVELLILKCYF